MKNRVIEEVTCGVCGNTWTQNEYDSLRPVDAPIGWCPSCGEDGEVGRWIWLK